MGTPRSSIREHFLAPGGSGRLERPDGVGRGSNAACGDRLELHVRLAAAPGGPGEGPGAEGGVETGGLRVALVRYEARGCAALTATASLVAWHLEGRALAEARDLDVARLVEEAGGLPPTKRHAPRLVQRALREALAHRPFRCHP